MEEAVSPTRHPTSNPIELRYLKVDHYEKGSDTVVAHFYIKDVLNLNIELEKDLVTLSFSSSHLSFLKTHGGDEASTSTIFKYTFIPKGSINVNESKHVIKPAFVEVTLKKFTSARWGGLEQLKMPVKRPSVSQPKTASTPIKDKN